MDIAAPPGRAGTGAALAPSPSLARPPAPAGAPHMPQRMTRNARTSIRSAATKGA